MTAGTRFNRLFEPGRIGQMEVRNRIVMPAMTSGCVAEDGHVNESLKNFLEARARGGVGLIIVEAAYIHRSGKIRVKQLSINDDKFIPGLSELAQVIQRHGAKAAIQIHHRGWRSSSKITGMQPLAPSPIPTPTGEMPKEVTATEIAEIVSYYTQAARRAKEAGFDAIELSMTTGGLVGQFLSRAYNKRQDTYGGEIRNRARFLSEVITAVRKTVGADYPIWCRIDGKEEEKIKDGITVEDAWETARIAEAAGAQAIHVYADYAGAPMEVTAQPLSGALLAYLAEGMKKVVTVPVITTGRISPEAGERILQERKADFISMGKALIADPELPNKAAAGRLDDIAPCIVCLRCIEKVVDKQGIVSCTVNAQAGHEAECTIKPAKKPRKVLVIGGGPAGMKAARVAALRGHQVTLCEKTRRLGGAMLLGAVVNPELEKLLRYMSHELEKSPVILKMNTEVTPLLVEKMKPEAVILAAGGVPSPVDIPGSNRSNVLTSHDILELMGGHPPLKGGIAQRWLWYLASILFRYFYNPGLIRWLLGLNFPVGKRVVIIGGGFSGCELGLALAKAGKRVTILEESSNIGADMGSLLRDIYTAKLKLAGARIEREVKVVEITDKGVAVNRGNSEEVFEADTVVLATDLGINDKLVRELKEKVPAVYTIGDAAEPAKIMEAVATAFRIANEI